MELDPVYTNDTNEIEPDRTRRHPRRWNCPIRASKPTIDLRQSLNQETKKEAEAWS